MRHLKNKIHLNRTASHRKALFGNLSAELFLHKRIETTLPKAKYTRRYAERMITFARRGDLAARRQVARFIRNPVAIQKLFSELGPHFKHRPGGYTRIIKLGPRRGDAAPMALLELVGFDDAVTPETKSTKSTGKSRLKAAQQVKSKKAKGVKVDRDKPEETPEAESTVAQKEVDVTESEATEVPEVSAAPEENDDTAKTSDKSASETIEDNPEAQKENDASEKPAESDKDVAEESSKE